MRRREFIAGVAGAAAWPLLADTQQSAKTLLTTADEIIQ